MTELAEAPAVERDGAITRIPHWIGGARVEGTSGRSGPVYNPAAGVQSGAVDLASVEEVHRAEAALQMDLLGHDFFLFTNAENCHAAVLYRRRDGNLGLIETTG